jgi:alpha,alpha-trehalase
MIFNLNIAQTLTLLLRQEDTNSDKKITIDDIGPKVFSITSISGQNYKVKGTYFLSNLLHEHSK